MVWRSILVHLDDDPSCDARVDLAARLARDRDARLIGVAPTGWVEWMYPVLPAPIGAEQLALAAEQLRRRAEGIVERFRARCASTASGRVAAHVDEGDAARAVVQRSHCSDVVVLGQPDPARVDHRQAQALLEQVVLHGARPTLVVPCAGRFDNVGASVIVAWNGGRECARAVADAMPLLCTATDVQLVQFVEPVSDDGQRAADSLQAVAQWLRWHGVQAQVRTPPGGIEVADALLSHVSDAGADLVVMGAWGRSRWAERVLGGATSGMLAQMTVPVLMSH